MSTSRRFVPWVAPAAHLVELSELALRRHESRYPDGPVRFHGTRVIVRHVQELFSAEGEHYGTGIVTIEGRRAFGGKVRFDPTSDPSVTGTSLPGDLDYLRHFARELLRVLQTLCPCGGLPGECVCRAALSGDGKHAGEDRTREDDRAGDGEWN